MKTLTLIAAAALALSPVAGSAMAAGLPGSNAATQQASYEARLATSAGQTYGAPTARISSQAVSNQPAPKNVMIPGSNASEELYSYEVRQIVSGSTGEGFVASERSNVDRTFGIPGSSADF